MKALLNKNNIKNIQNYKNRDFCICIPNNTTDFEFLHTDCNDTEIIVGENGIPVYLMKSDYLDRISNDLVAINKHWWYIPKIKMGIETAKKILEKIDIPFDYKWNFYFKQIEYKDLW